MTNRIILSLIILFALGQSSIAAPEKLPIPRFVSLRSNKINTHVGPGTTYPVVWTYRKQGLPVEIIAEFDTWRQIRDNQGSVGWVHKSLLSGARAAQVKVKHCKLFSKPTYESRVLAILEPGVVGKVKKCDDNWCQIDTNGHVGWIRKKFLWGVYAHEQKI